MVRTNQEARLLLAPQILLIVRVLRTWPGLATARNVVAGFHGTVIDRPKGSPEVGSVNLVVGVGSRALGGIGGFHPRLVPPKDLYCVGETVSRCAVGCPICGVVGAAQGCDKVWLADEPSSECPVRRATKSVSPVQGRG